VDKATLRRVKRTAPLRGLSPVERRHMVQGAFALRDGHGLAGRRVLLIDDVHTSGATAAACAAILKQGGAAHVRLLCWARVLTQDGAD
jgi:predicted amidophosphoribosyltransferase